MSQTIEIFGLVFKPTTHCVISPIDADEDNERAIELLIEHINKVSGRIFHSIKDVVWLRNVSFHQNNNETQSRIPIVVGFSEGIFKHFNLPTANKGDLKANSIAFKSHGPAIIINAGTNVPIIAAVKIFIDRHLTKAVNDVFHIGELDEVIEYTP